MFQCPYCATLLRLPPSAIGRDIRCPQCQGVFRAPPTEPNPSQDTSETPDTFHKTAVIFVAVTGILSFLLGAAAFPAAALVALELVGLVLAAFGGLCALFGILCGLVLRVRQTVYSLLGLLLCGAVAGGLLVDMNRQQLAARAGAAAKDLQEAAAARNQAANLMKEAATARQEAKKLRDEAGRDRKESEAARSEAVARDKAAGAKLDELKKREDQVAKLSEETTKKADEVKKDIERLTQLKEQNAALEKQVAELQRKTEADKEEITKRTQEAAELDRKLEKARRFFKGALQDAKPEVRLRAVEALQKFVALDAMPIFLGYLAHVTKGPAAPTQVDLKVAEKVVVTIGEVGGAEQATCTALKALTGYVAPPETIDPVDYGYRLRMASRAALYHIAYRYRKQDKQICDTVIPIMLTAFEERNNNFMERMRICRWLTTFNDVLDAASTTRLVSQLQVLWQREPDAEVRKALEAAGKVLSQ